MIICYHHSVPNHAFFLKKRKTTRVSSVKISRYQWWINKIFKMGRRVKLLCSMGITYKYNIYHVNQFTKRDHNHYC